MTTLVVVDGHNLINDVGRYFDGVRENQNVHEPAVEGEQKGKAAASPYYGEWFDVDRLVEATINQDIAQWRDLGIVIFRSKKAFGDGEYRVSGSDVSAFWGRQASNPNTSSRLVEIEGAPAGKDAGVDTAIVVYLYDTLNSWDAVVLFSNDTDFVPAVWSLRQKGKRVFCSAHVRDKSTPLVQSCQDFYPWNVDFLRADRALWEVLQPGGILDGYLRRGDVQHHAPRLATENGSLVLLPTREQLNAGHAARLNEQLGDWLSCELQSGGKLAIRPSEPPTPAGVSRKPLKSAAKVIAGLERHLEVFATAFWHQSFHGESSG